MTSWSAPGSPIRYFQCPFCSRTHSSLYGEVFRRRAGARVIDAPDCGASPGDIPMASKDDVRWTRVKATAARWFARLEAEERRCATHPPPPRALAAPGRTTGAAPRAPARKVVPAPAGRKR